MFAAVRFNLRNALSLVKPIMKLTEENYRANLAVLELLSEKRYVLLGLGEDVVTKSTEIVTESDRLSVDGGSLTPGVVTFTKASYAYNLLLRTALLEGSLVSYVVQKAYPDLTTLTFTANQMPLQSDNF